MKLTLYKRPNIKAGNTLLLVYFLPEIGKVLLVGKVMVLEAIKTPENSYSKVSLLDIDGLEGLIKLHSLFPTEVKRVMLIGRELIKNKPNQETLSTWLEENTYNLSAEEVISSIYTYVEGIQISDKVSPEGFTLIPLQQRELQKANGRFLKIEGLK